MAFDKYSELDPAKMQRDIEEMHGSVFFDKYAVLDDNHRVAQIEQAFGVEISNDALLDYTLLMQEVTMIADSGGEYTGPLDLVPGALLAFGNRAMSSAMRDQPLYTIEEDGGSTSQTFNADATTGDAPLSAISSFIGGANGLITSWNDQSGNARDAANGGGVSTNPKWTAGVSNSRPGVTTDANGVGLFSGSFPMTGGKLTILAACTVTTENGPTICALDAVDEVFSTIIGIGTWYNNQGDISVSKAPGGGEWATASTLSDGAHIIEIQVDAAGAATVKIDGADAGASLQFGSQSPIDDGTYSLEHPDRANGGTTKLELLLWNDNLDVSAAASNMADYYGITHASGVEQEFTITVTA